MTDHDALARFLRSSLPRQANLVQDYLYIGLADLGEILRWDLIRSATLAHIAEGSLPRETTLTNKGYSDLWNDPITKP